MSLSTIALTRVNSYHSFGGWQQIYRHPSEVLGCDMKVGVYLPPQAEWQRCPVLYWLSGLTCTEQNFITKAGAQQHAARHGFILVAPDTSPRGCDVPGEEDSWDLGTGASFYVNATQAPWAQHYRMYDYIVSELPQAIAGNFPVLSGRQGIMGHSMGGHGALVVALRNPDQFQSVSAFAPIVAPMQVAWGQKAFRHYLGNNRFDWQEYDATELVKRTQGRLPILIDQGEADAFLAEQLRPELFEQACESVDYPLTLRRHPDYDHSYYFISTFIGDHFDHHAVALK
jgi:S-formylglutathione hydrolase